jgi:hypothetical protein
MGWLHCVPSGELGKSGVSRFELVGHEEVERITPPMGELTYLFSALSTVGLCENVMGGFSPVKWSELMHWPGIKRFLECEIETMQRLSRTYAQMRNNGDKADQPWEPE